MVGGQPIEGRTIAYGSQEGLVRPDRILLDDNYQQIGYRPKTVKLLYRFDFGSVISERCENY